MDLGRIKNYSYICHTNNVTMKTISRTFFSIRVGVLFFTVIPIFYFLFVLAYNPFGSDRFLSEGPGFTLNLIITTLIVLGVMVLSRVLIFLLRRVMDLDWSLYILWCAGEVILCGLFASIPMGLSFVPAHNYFSVMSQCVLFMAAILAIPLSIITLAVQAYILNRRAQSAPQVDEKKLLRFYDELKRLKLVVSSEAVLYLASEENYVHIVYLENGRVRKFTLRSSMRALEENLTPYGLVRCHRSYFLNIAHVDLIRKDANGYALAQLDREGMDPIPVSKRYYEALIHLL